MNSEAEPARILCYDPSHRRSLDAFFEQVFTPSSLRRSADWFCWHVNDNPHASHQCPTLLLAYVQEKVVGVLFLIPTQVWIAGQAHHMAWGRDLFVDPEYRRQKIGLLLNRRWASIFSAALGSGQSDMMRSLQQKYGWTVISRIKQYEKRLLDRHALSACRRNGLSRIARRALAMAYGSLHPPAARTPRGYRVSHGSTFSPAADGLWESCRNEYPCIAARDGKTLNWRFYAHPYFRHTVTELLNADDRYRGYMVSRSEGETCMIIDGLTRPGDQKARRLLVNAIEAHHTDRGCRHFTVRCACPPLQSCLVRRGYLPTPFNQHACYYSTSLLVDRLASGMYITTMDSDLDR